MQWYDYYIRCWKHYFDFKGRARRTELLIFLVCNRTIHNLCRYMGESDGNVAIMASLVALIFSLVTFIPEVAVCVRRLHDIGQTGWWMVLPILFGITTHILTFYFELEILSTILFVAFAVTIICLLVISMKDSQPGTNKWGSNPKEEKKPI